MFMDELIGLLLLGWFIARQQCRLPSIGGIGVVSYLEGPAVVHDPFYMLRGLAV